MKKLGTLVVLAAILAMTLSGCYTHVRRPGIELDTPIYDKQVMQTVTNPDADFTGDIAPAIADSIRGNGNGNQPQITEDKKGVITNSCNYDIFVEVTIAYLPGNIDAYKLKQNGVQNIPGYEDWSEWVPARGKAQYSLKELTLKPGSWDVRVYRRSGNGKKLIKNTYLLVDVRSGRHNRNGVNYDFVFDY